MSTTALSTRHPRGVNPKGGELQYLPRVNRFKLPEYLEMAKVLDLLVNKQDPHLTSCPKNPGRLRNPGLYVKMNCNFAWIG